MKKTKKIFVIALIIVILFGGYTYLKNKNNSSNLPSPEVTEVFKDNLELVYEVQGEVASEKTVLIYPTLSGKVKKVNYRLGDQVSKGDVLAVIDESSLTEINSNIEKAKILLNQRRKEYNDLLSLYNVGGVSKSELDKANDNLRLANLDLNNILNSSNEVSNRVVSTVSGVITETYVDENLQVDRGKYLFKIVDVENLKINAEIPNSKVKNMKEGNKVIISSDSLDEGVNILAKIDEISKISTKNSKFNDAVTTVKINLEKNSGLKPGDIVVLKIIYEEIKDATLVSALDIEEENGQTYVYILDENNTVRKKNVVLGKSDGNYYEVKSGINSGDRVINNTFKLYKDGDKIK